MSSSLNISDSISISFALVFVLALDLIQMFVLSNVPVSPSISVNDNVSDC